MAVATFAAQCGFDQCAVSDITLAVGEACTSAIANSTPNNEFILACTYQNDTLTVEIESYGSASRMPEANGDTSETRGLGVLLMRKLVDSVEYEFTHNDGSKVILTKRMPVYSRGTFA